LFLVLQVIANMDRENWKSKFKTFESLLKVVHPQLHFEQIKTQIE